MTKTQIVARIREISDLPDQECIDIVGLVFEFLAQALGQGRRVEIRGLGTFFTRRLRAFDCRGAFTDHPVPIPDRRTVRFRRSVVIDRALNPPKVS